MERIYCDSVTKAENEEFNELLLKIVSISKEATDKLNKKDLKIWLYNFHNYIREKFNLPNKLFTIIANEDNTKAQMIFFPKEPDGNYYQPFYDEELKQIYILVD